MDVRRDKSARIKFTSKGKARLLNFSKAALHVPSQVGHVDGQGSSQSAEDFSDKKCKARSHLSLS